MKLNLAPIAMLGGRSFQWHSYWGWARASLGVWSWGRSPALSITTSSVTGLEEGVEDNLRLPEPEWKSATPKKKKDGGEPSGKTPLYKNLKLLKEWGMGSAGIDVVKDHRKLATLNPSVVESKLKWLVNALGCDRQQCVKIVRNYPLYLGLSLEENVGPFVNTFLEGGFSKQDVRGMVMEAPEILGRRGKFGHMLEYFESELSFNKHEFGEAIMQFPKVVFLSIDDEIKPMVSCFREAGVEFDDLVVMLKKRPGVLLLDLEGDIKPKLWEFHNLGFSKEGVGKVASGCPNLLWKDFDKMVVQYKIDFLAKKVGFGREETLRVLESDPMKLIDNLRTWRETHKWFLMNGLGKEESIEYFKNNMHLLSRRWEGLEEKLNFAREVLGKSTEDVMRCPRYFNASFDNVTLFRTAFLISIGYDFEKKALGFLIVSKRIFEKRFDKGEIASFKKMWASMSPPEKKEYILKRSSQSAKKNVPYGISNRT